MAYTLALGMPGLTEWIIIGALGLLIFGKRLPEVGRSLGKGIVEFKKGLKGIEDEVGQVDSDLDHSNSRPRPVLEEKKTEYKFDPYTGKPIEQPKFDPYTGKPIESSAAVSEPEHTTSPT